MTTFHLFLGIGVFVIVLVTVLILLVVSKAEEIYRLRAALQKMTKSFNDLDEQAKLIVRTDLELNKAQEELDKRLNSLDALQKTSRLISTTLDENEIFRRLDQSLMLDLGFEKDLLCVYDKNRSLQSRLSLGFTPQEVQSILARLEKDAGIKNALKEGHAFSSITSSSRKPIGSLREEPISQQARETIIGLFDVEHFVLTPVLTQNTVAGFLFVGNRSNSSAITEGDEELTSILADQIGQALENARLFEEVYRSSQALESRIQDRTRQLASALEEVKNINKAKSEFISAVSHELRTPLTSVKGYAALLMSGKLGDIPEGVKERLQKINLHSDNLVKLINNLLDIARIESGRVEMKMEKCSVTALIEGTRDLLMPQMREKNLQWKDEIAPNMPELTFDKHQIERIFINLVSNAIKFTPTHGTITVRARRDGPVAVFEVSDTGIGISKEDLGKLFNEFYRVDNEINQNVKGTGLGLSLVKKIVEAHQGKIWITSEINRGTTFHFTLPVDPPAPRPTEGK
ncbi:MAG: GAF domain-containing sensor histidine kinase [Candidatus Omnitrophica bacterium]|nr:GAF domain-containing sensor histidine kinase [Candidatus Omnitrophota bacterium]